LDEALTRLEKAVDSHSGESGGNTNMVKELAAATSEISDLKDKSKAVSTRLDGAIGQLKELLRDG